MCEIPESILFSQLVHCFGQERILQYPEAKSLGINRTSKHILAVM